MDNGIQKIYRLDNQPFAQIPREAIRDPRITSNGFRLLAYLMSHQHGYELTYGQIERETGLGRFAINGAIVNLTQLGWVNVQPTKLDNGQFGPKQWQVLNPTTVGNSTAGDSTVEQPTDNKNKNKENKTKEIYIPKQELEEEFLRFWNYYPRKTEKLAARKAFDKACEVAGAEIIVAGAERMSRDPNLPPKQFVPYPATWLNAGQWEDEPYPERQLTAEEKAAKAEAERVARELVRQKQREEDTKRMQREREEGEKARASVTLCEHNRIIHVCLKCSPFVKA